MRIKNFNIINGNLNYIPIIPHKGKLIDNLTSNGIFSEQSIIDFIDLLDGKDVKFYPMILCSENSLLF